MSPSVLTLARQKMESADFEAALQILESGLLEAPFDPELNAETGLLLTCLQREFEALPRLDAARGSASFDRLAQTLVDYSFARRQMADRLGILDEAGHRFADQVTVACPGLSPSSWAGSQLSACLIVKNEEQTLARCLSSLQQVCDEIIVVDTGSTDRTVEIAESFGAKIGYFEWCNDFSAARNHALSLATGNWILWIDADEELDPAGISLIQEGLMRPQFGGYFIRIINFMTEGSRTDQYVHTPVRLFQNRPEIFFTGAIHEQVLPQILDARLVTATLSGPTVWHYGYTAEMMRDRQKEERTISMLEEELRKNPEDSFQWFNLANVFAVANRSEESVRAAREAIRTMAPNSAHGSLTWYLLAHALVNLGQSEEALQACDEAFAAGYDDILTRFQRTHALSTAGRFEEALAAVDELLTLDWPTGLNGDYGIFTHKRMTLKGQILAQLGRTDEAFEWLDRSLEVDPNYSYAKFLKGSIMAQTGAGQAAIPLLEPTFGPSGLGLRAHVYAATAWANEGNWAESHRHGEIAFDGGEREESFLHAWIQAAEKLNFTEKVAETYTKISPLLELSASHRVNWGRALLVLGRAEEALIQFDEAITQEPRNANAAFNRADALYAIRDFGRAVEAYQIALDLAPAYADGWFCFGNSLAQIGADQAAAVAYRQALMLDPNHTRAQHNLDVVESTAA